MDWFSKPYWTTEEICKELGVEESVFWQAVEEIAREEGLSLEDWMKEHINGYGEFN